MNFLFFIGIFVSAVGLGGVIYCITTAIRKKRRETSDTILRTKIWRLVKINLVSFLLALFGVGVCVVGLLL